MQKDDMIYRQDVLDVFEVEKELLSRVLDDTDVVGCAREKYSWVLEQIEAYINDIKELPSIQLERKKGKWIPHHKEISREYVGAASIITIKHDYWFCDTCGYRVEGRQPMYNFCPHCGAEMMNGGDGHVNADA